MMCRSPSRVKAIPVRAAVGLLQEFTFSSRAGRVLDDRMRRWLAASFLILVPCFLTGCAVGPDYVPPPPGAPAAWHSLPQGMEVRAEAVGAWWEGFGDPVLISLIRRAVAANLDLRAAASRVAEARALYRVEASAEFPAVEAGGSVFRERASENLPLPGGQPVTIHSASVSASWEVDLFGRVRRL